jgi:hypothetical protein
VEDRHLGMEALDLDQVGDGGRNPRDESLNHFDESLDLELYKGKCSFVGDNLDGVNKNDLERWESALTAVPC